MTKTIVCLWGGPGTGKSTTAAGLFYQLKTLGYNCELNREYVKDWVWEGRGIQTGDQTYIFAKQARKERQYIKNGLDYIITDSPMALSIMYGHKYDKYEREFGACEVLLKQHHAFCKDHGYKVEHIFLIRQKEYNPAGRYQTQEQAVEIDAECLALLNELKINYRTMTCSADVVADIAKLLIGEDAPQMLSHLLPINKVLKNT